MTRLKCPSGHRRTTGFVIPERSVCKMAAIDAWYSLCLNARNFGLSSYPRSPKLLRSVQCANVDNNKKELTFWDGKEGDGYNRIPMGASDGVVRVPNRQVERVILYMASRHRDCGLIAPKDNGAVH